MGRHSLKLLGALLLVAGGLLPGCSRAPATVQFITEGKPAMLSEWRVLAVHDRHLTLNSGVLPYDLNTPLFTDHAQKLRTVWMPAGTAAAYSERDSFDFPVGTILTKTFYYPRGDGASVRQTAAMSPTEAVMRDGLDLSSVRLLETRVLVRRAEGWLALPYVWNAEQTDAVLERTGDAAALDLVDDAGAHHPFTYVIPNENQCAACHVVNLKSKAFQPIGPKARHLNRDLSYADGNENQLVRWARAGYLNGLPEKDRPRAADWRDASSPLADRARAYLDINCAHCHQAGGPASNSALSLDAHATVDRTMGLCKSPVAAGKGTGDRLYGIVPGQPDASIMTYRLSSTEGGVMMPELGRNTVHEEGLQLIRQWIASLPGHCNPL